MKKTVILILFLLIISLVNAQKTEETVALEKLNLKRIETKSAILADNPKSQI